MKRFSASLLAALCAVASAYGQQTPELFPFFAMGDHLPDVWVAPDSQKTAGAAGQVRVAGNHFATDSGEIRFWGVNTCFSMNFPDKEAAVQYARRMARFGINAVRLHHMDSRDIWGKNLSRTMTEIDPEQLDRLDWLIYQFKLNGIYVNINLHVSRKFADQDGFGGYDQRPGHDKGLDNFDPRMIAFQKKYARDLLGHVNPYTKMSYLEDPCVAMIEINNENSVMASWFWGQLDNLPEEYNAEFQRLWNVWLKDRYGTTAKLREAWACRSFPAGGEMLQDGAFAEGKAFRDGSPWRLETDANTRATLKISPENTLSLAVEKIGDVAWHPQFYCTGLSVEEGVPYTLKFRARANRKCTAGCGASQNHPEWHNLGLSERFDLDTEWREFSFRFLATQTDDNARVSFSAFEPGTVYEYDDFSLTSGGEVGLAEGQNLESASIQIVRRNSRASIMTQEARRDFGRFVMDLENRYWQEMFHFVKDELGANAPVSGTQLQYGTHYAQARLDYCDIHAYWNHPSFPGRPWDGGNWKLGNTSIVNALGCRHSTATNLANNRVLGKPFTVSEYNHPYPNLYGAEGFPVLSSIAAFQNWSGIFIFAWSHTSAFSVEGTPSFFDICGNSVQLVHMPACYNMFVRGDVRNAIASPDATKVVYDLGEEQERGIHVDASSGYHRSIGAVGFRHEQPLKTSVGVRLLDMPELRDPAMDGVRGLVPPEEPPAPPTETVSETGQLRWNGAVPSCGYYQVDSRDTKVFTGFVAGRTFGYEDGTRLEIGPTILDWATVTWTRTAPDRWLLAATGVMRNTDCNLGLYDPEWIEDTPTAELPKLLDQQISFCKKRGRAPTLCEGIPAKLRFPVAKGRTATVYPLDGDAVRGAGVQARRLDDQFVEITIGPQFKTLWYEIEVK